MPNVKHMESNVCIKAEAVDAIKKDLAANFKVVMKLVHCLLLLMDLVREQLQQDQQLLALQESVPRLQIAITLMPCVGRIIQVV